MAHDKGGSGPRHRHCGHQVSGPFTAHFLGAGDEHVPANQRRWHARVRMECDAVWTRPEPGQCACGQPASAAHAYLRCPLLHDLQRPLIAKIRDWLSAIRATGVSKGARTPEDAVRWIHTDIPWTSPLEGVPNKGRALRAVAHSFSVQASAAHLRHLRAPGAK